MIPSIKLRKIISKKYSLDLEEYSWDRITEKSILDIKVYDESCKNLRKVFKHGFNIGNCFITSTYIALSIPGAKLCFGKVPILERY